MATLLPETQTVDETARVRLPEQFANSTVTVRAVSESEVVIRRAPAASAEAGPDEVPPLQPLSNEDRDFFLDLCENPPEPSPAFRAAAAKYKEWYERNPDPPVG